MKHETPTYNLNQQKTHSHIELPSMYNIDSATHLRGESIYLDDIQVLQGTLYAAVFASPVAHGIIEMLDLDDAQLMPGVVKIFTEKDICGENQIGGIIPDEPLLADEHVHFCGMPIALVVAHTIEEARNAVKKIKVKINPLHVITDEREAYEKNELISPPRTHECGNTQLAWQSCDYIFEGQTKTNGQEHLYIETQGAYAIPQENNAIKIYSSTQGPTAVQKAVSKILGLPQHMLEIEVTRLGGGFGGKEDQANTWAALCALAAYSLQKPVKYSLHRMEDMAMTGKRHPYSADYKIGLDNNLKIIAYEVLFFQNAGAAADLSPAVLERTLLHCTNSYFIPNVKATAYSCRTNLPPNTAFRGFGGPQGMFVIEAAIASAAQEIGVEASLIQKRNLLVTGDEFAYGQKVESEALQCWQKAEELYNITTVNENIKNFNAINKWHKKGLSFMPVCFGISFTNTMMNHARSLVHVYADGSVNISTGAVEMGQGVNTKILQAAQQIFSIHPERIKILNTNTYRIANTSPSAASATADLNGKATMIACNAIIERLKKVLADELSISEDSVILKNEKIYVNEIATDWTWQTLVMAAFTKRVSLSEHAHYTTPNIHYNKSIEKGHPFAYHVFGTAITTVTVDCVRGIYEIDNVKIVHDFGASMNEIIDKGQIEGGLVQGIGWMTMEEVIYNNNGRLVSNALSTYKVPDIYAVPKLIDIHFLETTKDNLAVLKSKAVGEPPLMYGIGTYFALQNAIRAFNVTANLAFDAPMTPEKVLLNLYSK